ncbi:MAG: hypothetical protein ABIW76_07700 [Fibrobacteria bacterium]
MLTRLLLLLTLACAPAFAALGIRTDGHLNMPELNQAYLGGEKPEVRLVLEGFLKHHPADVTREEKMFTHLYLGVLWAPDSQAMARAASHFEALLRLDPEADPGDLPMPLAVRNFFVRVKRGSRDKLSQTEARTEARTGAPNAGMSAAIIRSAMEETVNTSFDNPHARRSIEVRFIPGKPVPFSNYTGDVRTAGNRPQP